MAVHLSGPLAAWVVQHGGLDKSQLVQKNSELFPTLAAAAQPYFLTPAAARELQNGAVMARLLASLFRENGADCPVSVGALAPGTEAAVVLRNWKECLLPVLRRTFAMDISADKLALLVGGDSEVLTLLVDTLCNRATGVQGAAEEAEPLLKKLTSRFDADVVDSIYLFGSLVTGLYSAVLASLLGIFVPQTCPPTAAMPQSHVCSTAENLLPQSQLNGAVLAFNFITLLCVLAAQFFFGYREYWCIQSFDFDKAVPNDNLAQEVLLYPAFHAKLRAVNRQAYAACLGLVAVVALNFILSCVHVLRDYSEGKASATALFSYTLLLVPRVLGWLLNAHKAHWEEQPVSFFIKTPALPNTIDADWKYKPAVYKPRYSGGGAAPACAADEELSLLTTA